MNIRFRNKWLIGLVILLFGLVYFSVVISNHYYFRTFCYDYGVYNNAFYDFAHFRVNQSTLFDPPLDMFCQVHMSFILNFVSPVLYWTIGQITGTYTLLLFQVLIILTAGFYVFKLVQLKSADFWLPLIAMIHFFSLWGHFSALPADYIDTTVGASLVPIFLYYHAKKKFIITSFLFVFLLITKENFPIWLIFISLTLILLYPKDKIVRRINLIYIGVAILYFIIIFNIVIPAVQDPDRPYWGFTYSALGESPSEAILTILKNPVRVLKTMFVNHTDNPIYDGIKTEFYFMFLASGGVLLFYHPRYLIMFIPLIAQKVFNDHYLRWGINSFYSIEIVSILSIAVFLTIIKIKQKMPRVILAMLVCLSTIVVTAVKLDSRKSLYYLPGKERFYDLKLYRSDFNIKEINRALRTIPKESKVSASERVVSHLAFRSHIYCFPNVTNADHIVLLSDNHPFPLTIEQFEDEKEKYLSDKDWETVYHQEPLVIFRRKKEK